MLTQQQILSATLNDIVFQDRNQAYGAYVLRNTYNHHLKIAIGVMLGLCLSAFLIYFNGSFSGSQKDLSIFNSGPDVILDNVPIPQIKLPPPPQQPPVVEQVIRTEVFTKPLLVIDKNVSDEDLPPAQNVLEGARIGLAKSEGVDVNNVVAPPVEQRGVGNVLALKTTEIDYNSVFTKVENPAEFPGGASEWSRYLQKNLRYPDQAIDNGTQAVIRVQFIVDKDGNISEVHALNDPGDGLAEEAVRIIKKGPKWKPAEQNGQKVVFRNIQAVTFRLN